MFAASAVETIISASLWSDVGSIRMSMFVRCVFRYLPAEERRGTGHSRTIGS